MQQLVYLQHFLLHHTLPSFCIIFTEKELIEQCHYTIHTILGQKSVHVYTIQLSSVHEFNYC